jgi:hypothetical protein
MATIEELRAQRDALRSLSFKLSDEEQEKADMALDIERHQMRLDEELSIRLQAEARIAYAEAKAELAEKQIDTPIDVVWSLQAYKLCKVGWLVIGPEDKGHAAMALKASGKLDGSGKYKVQEKDPDRCREALCRTTTPGCGVIKAPPTKDALSRALMDAPEFVVACFEKMRELGGAYVKDVAGK